METAFAKAWRSAVGESPAIEASVFPELVNMVEAQLSKNVEQNISYCDKNIFTPADGSVKDNERRKRLDKSISSYITPSSFLLSDSISRKTAEALVQHILGNHDFNEPPSPLVSTKNGKEFQQILNFISRPTPMNNLVDPDIIMSDYSDDESLMDLRANSPSLYDEDGPAAQQYFLRELLNDIHKRHLKIKTLFSKSELLLIDMDQQSKAELQWLKELSERNNKILSEVNKMRIVLTNVARDLGMESRLEEHISERTDTNTNRENCIESILIRENLSKKIITSNDSWPQNTDGLFASKSVTSESLDLKRILSEKRENDELRSNQETSNTGKENPRLAIDFKERDNNEHIGYGEVDKVDKENDKTVKNYNLEGIHAKKTSGNIADDSSDTLLILAVIIAFVAFFGPIVFKYGDHQAT